MEEEDVTINLPCVRLSLEVADFHVKRYIEQTPSSNPIVESYRIAASVKRALAASYGRTTEGYVQDICISSETAKKLFMIPDGNKKWVR